MTDLERFVKRLLDTLKARHPTGAQRPVTVAELRSSILPYRMHRSALKLSSSEDYELLVLRLVAEEGGYTRTTPSDAAERAREEVAAPVPDLHLVELLDDATIQLTSGVADRLAATESAEVVQVVESALAPVAVEPEVSGPDQEADAAQTDELAVAEQAVEGAVTEPDAGELLFEEPFSEDVAGLESMGRAEVQPSAPFEPLADSVSVDGVTASPLEQQACGSCDEPLPADRGLAFCPFCGERVGVRRCRRCGSEMDAEWRYCGACGEPHVR